jgi:hypothetical protein
MVNRLSDQPIQVKSLGGSSLRNRGVPKLLLLNNGPFHWDPYFSICVGDTTYVYGYV